MATGIKSTSSPVSRTSSRSPAARLDASLLLARKGEATPAVAATQHNNPALAWGAAPHPEDFKTSVQQAPVSPRPKPVATARLRADSFLAKRVAKGKKRAGEAVAHEDDVTLMLRLEEEAYLRLKYLAQTTGLSTQNVLKEALRGHLLRKGVSRSKKIVIQYK